MDRRGGKGKHPKGAKRNADFKGKKHGGKRRPQKDESDREEEEARDEMTELQNRAQGQYFEAFSESSEEDGAIDNELDQDESQESQPEVPSEFQINGEYFKTLLKDLRLYDLRLAKLNSLQKSVHLTQEGREFVEKYRSLVSVYCMYLMYYTYLASQGGVTVHPVLRTLAKIKENVKVMDKEFAKHKEIANQLLAAVPQDEDDGAEEGDEENEEMMEEFSEGEEEMSEDGPVAHIPQPRVKQPDQAVKKVAKPAQKPKRQLQVFKLDGPKSYADIHHYAADDDDEDDGVLNLNGKATAESSNGGEITMDDFKAFAANMSEPKKAKKPSKKGKQLYEELAAKKTEAKSLSNALREEAEAALDEYERKLMFNERKVKEDQPRTLTEEMLLNRGLRQKRKNVISKVKIRGKYEKAKRLDRIRKGLSLEDGRSKDIHMIRSTGEGVVRDISLN